jgi:propionyl-CoA carboxylase alpha chain
VFKKILIANRGEIACRVIKSAQKMGIATVAVYSDADCDALHVQMADEAVRIGAPPSTESYLVAERIIQACIDTGAEAVHPGYGFLSENSSFCEALAAKGIAFIGPKTRAIEAMGDKITSKKLADNAKVNTIPGYTDVVKDAKQAVTIANDIGYPVMLKASAGGGGKGMRIARNDDECLDGFERAANEARSSFGDDRIFIEKFIEEPRHIEIQVMADSHGNVVYLNERECSLQRSPEGHRGGAVAVPRREDPQDDGRAGRGPRKGGRLRVGWHRRVHRRSQAQLLFPRNEHAPAGGASRHRADVTTGIDLVELMIRVAAGEKLPIAQKDVGINGWAIESRVYAEDPFRNFLPSTGRLVYYRPPVDDDHVRVDTGVYEGGEVSMFYDPMVAKLITWGEDRNQAIEKMRTALDKFLIRGISTNISFLSALMAHEKYVTGNISTNTIAEEYPDGFHPGDVPLENPAIIIAVVGSMVRKYRDRAAQIDGQLPGHQRSVPADWVVVLNEQYHPISVRPAEGGNDVIYNGETYEVRSDWEFGQQLFTGTINGEDVFVQVGRTGQVYRLSRGGKHRVAASNQM